MKPIITTLTILIPTISCSHKLNNRDKTMRVKRNTDYFRRSGHQSVIVCAS